MGGGGGGGGSCSIFASFLVFQCFGLPIVQTRETTKPQQREKQILIFSSPFTK